jgi:hypothetical protein
MDTRNRDTLTRPLGPSEDGWVAFPDAETASAWALTQGALFEALVAPAFDARAFEDPGFEDVDEPPRLAAGAAG